eukprot:COSAG06_NODE_62086_length_266_cov_0.598802_1_plen_43_part_10
MQGDASWGVDGVRGTDATFLFKLAAGASERFDPNAGFDPAVDG